jgi:outer membrane protein
MKPNPRLILLAAFVFAAFTAVRAQNPQPQNPQKLTLRDAERIALENHPQIRAAQFTADAVQQTVTESRSSYYPYSIGSITAVEADHNSRIAAGGLNNPVIYNRESNGLTIGQLITDFGRTRNLVETSNFNAQAEQQNVAAKREDILLQVNQAYFAALRAQAILMVAQETVKERQLLVDQVTALAQSNLKSSLDVSFATVNLGEAKLLLVQAQNELQAANMNLSTALGYSSPQLFELAEEPLPAAPSADLSGLVADALRDRPDLLARRLKEQAAGKFATAERDLWFPSISALGAAGLTPVRQAEQLTLTSRYAAAGVNVNIPIFNGHLFSARSAEARLRDEAEGQYVKDMENRISRDVRLAWLNSKTAFERLDLTSQLLDQASQALELAQARYNLGLSSIVELSQAQLNITAAKIQQASAKYDYQSLLAALNAQIGALH